MGGKGGKGGKGRYNYNQGKGQGWLEDWASRAPKAVAQQESYHVSILRAYPGKTGELFIKKGGARNDMELLSPQGMAARLTAQNTEALNRPEKWLSMASGAVRQAFRVLMYAGANPGKTGIDEITEGLSDSLLAAATMLDTTQRVAGQGEEVQEAVQEVLRHFADTTQVPHLQRVAVYSASLYGYTMHALEAFCFRKKSVNVKNTLSVPGIVALLFSPAKKKYY